MLTPKQKVIKYLEIKEISQDKFSRKCDVSSGFLRQGKSFGVELLPKIRDNFNDLNLNWLIYNEGNMLLEAENYNVVREEKASYGLNPCEKEIMSLQKKVISIQDDLIAAKTIIENYQKEQLS